MKNKARLSNKIYRKIHWIIFDKMKPGRWIYYFYPAYHHRKYKPKKGVDKNTVYITQIPNEGAGIGHQIANFNGGYHYSEIFNIPFAYPGFHNKSWDEFLGFGENEISVKQLKKNGYIIRKLPYFNESEQSLALIRQIINSYAGKKVILSVELDQFYQNQYEVIPYIKRKFESATARKNDKMLYNENEINVALHIRRGDICKGQKTGNKSLTKRWLTLEYFENIIKNLKDATDKRIHIYIFSQGEEKYEIFEKYGKITYCIDMSEKDSFLHMVRADILIISKSSFSYKPALLSDGIRICPPDFWHGYPKEKEWIIASPKGEISIEPNLLSSKNIMERRRIK